MTSKKNQATENKAENEAENEAKDVAEQTTTEPTEIVSFEIAGSTGTAADMSLDIAADFNSAVLLWKGDKLFALERGEKILSPKLTITSELKLKGAEATVATEHANKWLSDYIEANLKSLVVMDNEINQNIVAGDNQPLTGHIKEVAQTLLNNLGIMSRSLVEEKLKVISTEDRKGLWRFKIKIGASTIFIPFILKPAPTQLRLLLWSLFEKQQNLPAAPTPGMVWVQMEKDVSPDFYRLSGYSPAGKKAVRVDMVERLADAVRPLGLKGASFEVTPEVMGLVGLSGEAFADVMKAIGYMNRKHTAKEEGKEEKEFYSFAWLGAKKPAKPKPQPQNKKTKVQNKKAELKKTKEFVLDPNSPFAALAGLKESMTKPKKGS